MFIKNTLAVEITMSSVKTVVVIFREKFEIKQHDKVLHKQQSLGLSQKHLFPNEDIIEENFALHYRTDFTFKKHMLVVEIDKKGHNERPPNYEKRRQKDLEKLGYYFIRINLINQVLMIMKNLVKYKSILMNQLKNKLKNC